MIPSTALLLLAPALAFAAVLPRDEKQDWINKVDAWALDKRPPQILIDAFKNKPEGELTLDTYKSPNEYVRTIFSPGDSYTAGIGSNGNIDHYGDSGNMNSGGCSRYAKGWPEQLREHPGWDELQGAGYRRNNFGACSGALVNDIIEKQLEPGQSDDKDLYKRVGKDDWAPQLAVLTAAGNDAQFSDIIKTCIYNTRWFAPSCDEVLKGVEDKLVHERDLFKKQLQRLWAKIIVVGRMAGGATPPETFQVYAGTYVPFFNDDDKICDEVDWNLFSNTYKLTRELRKRMNNLVLSLNDIIREAADEYKEYGVFWVDSYHKAFDGHRFCDPTGYSEEYDKRYHNGITADKGSQTWFWSLNSDWEDDTEGPDHPLWNDIQSPETGPNVSQAILDHLIPDKMQQAQISEQNPPGKFNAVFNDEDTFNQAIKDLTVKDGDVEINLNDGWLRVFHPKGQGLTAFRDGFFETIKTNRNWDFHSQEQQPSPPSPPSPPSEVPNYKAGICSFHLEHIWRCPHEQLSTQNKALSGKIELRDADGQTLEIKDFHDKVIKPTDEFQLWDLDIPEDVQRFKSLLPKELWIDPFIFYLKFGYDSQSWYSDADNDETKTPHCRTGEWTPDYLDFPLDWCASRKEGDEMTRRSMECYFTCD